MTHQNPHEHLIETGPRPASLRRLSCVNGCARYATHHSDVCEWCHLHGNPNRPQETRKPSPDTKPDTLKPQAATPYEYFPRALLAVAQISTFGAQKYGRGTWVSLPNGHQRRTDAFHRHLLAHAAGQKCDPESGLSHLAHALWNLMSMVEWEAREAEKETKQ